MKFLGKWYLLFFIGLSSLVFVGCEESAHQRFIRQTTENLERHGFSHGTSMFLAMLIFVVIGTVSYWIFGGGKDNKK
ncbi:hypothetical protein [Helicobacter cetorum]|uniref:Lipoprotein n=1 Tax=Helicobacter cetorum (strain ATCC BAA-429 / MIT 00-7128) TaxID=182217 RepID=I0EL71_HELC0|nr:hypothetical protein [Helicobacter cetorum]AFI03690.1 hypothetical protein HCW_02025 [Helicobacter cetorum MIT 00-7128]